MNDYLVFQTQAEAQYALEVVYAEMVKAVDSPDLLNVNSGQVVQKSAITDEQAISAGPESRDFPVFGCLKMTGKKITDSGYTKTWAIERQRETDGKWVFVAPPEAMRAGLEGYTVEPYDASWFPRKQYSIA